ncbi:MAG: hypothetical protein M1489_06345 [Firmicutes bacterium]|nr:hypothetical protein [Bacillota bacterium]
MAENEKRELDLLVNITGDEETKSKLKAIDRLMEQSRMRGEALNRMRVSPVASLDDRISAPPPADRASRNRIEGTWLNEKTLAGWSGIDLYIIGREAAEDAGEFEQAFGNTRYSYPELLQPAGNARTAWSALKGATDAPYRRHFPDIPEEIKETPGSKIDDQLTPKAGKVDERISEEEKEKTKNKLFSGLFDNTLDMFESAFDAVTMIKKTEPGRIPKAPNILEGARALTRGFNILSDADKIIRAGDEEATVKAAAEVAGSRMGSAAGAAVGSFAGPVGKFAGGFIGGYLGEKAAGLMVDLYNSTDSMVPTAGEVPFTFDELPAEEISRDLKPAPKAGWILDAYRSIESMVPTAGEIPFSFDDLPAEETSRGLTPDPNQVNQNVTVNVTVNSQADVREIANEVADKIANDVGKVMQNMATACSNA